jgi:L-2,4-diaminobutyric acid acetyltransferase
LTEYRSQLAGFISSYRHPEKQDTLFVWQVVVHKDMRGRRIAGQMLDRLISEGAPWASYIETTVTPSNDSSLRFFQNFAEMHETSCRTMRYMTKDLFCDDSHEEEILLRIGPL